MNKNALQCFNAVYQFLVDFATMGVLMSIDSSAF